MREVVATSGPEGEGEEHGQHQGQTDQMFQIQPHHDLLLLVTIPAAVDYNPLATTFWNKTNLGLCKCHIYMNLKMPYSLH